jgi:hypothetical protein
VVVVVNVGKVVRQQPSVSAADRPDQHRGPAADPSRSTTGLPAAAAVALPCRRCSRARRFRPSVSACARNV